MWIDWLIVKYLMFSVDLHKITAITLVGNVSVKKISSNTHLGIIKTDIVKNITLNGNNISIKV